MKKILFSAAILAAFASCSKNETANVTKTGEIAFSTLNDRVTKAANDAAADYQVYASKTTGTAWFINETLDGEANTINSENKYYYDGSEISFMAYAPATAAAVANTFPALSVAYTVNADADEDFTVAGAKQSEGEVVLQFAHQLAKVTISSELNDDLGQYTLTAGTATLIVNESVFTVDLVGGTVTAAKEKTAATYTGASSYMIAPQTAIGCQVQLNGIKIQSKTDGSYIVGSADAGADMSVHTIVTKEVEDDTFAAGNHYAVKLTITPSSTDGNGDDILGDLITFSSDVTGWEDANGAITQE